MEEIKKAYEVITIRKEVAKTKDGKDFDKYTMNDGGKSVQLGWHKASNKLDVIPYGVSKVRVEDLSPCATSFYPKNYATFLEVEPKEEK